MDTTKLTKSGLDSLNWQQLLTICLAKQKFEKALEQWRAKGLKRFFSRKPKDPCPAAPAHELAIRYSDAFNRSKSCGRRVTLHGATTLHYGIHPENHTCRPVLTATYYDENDGCAYDERFLVEETGRVVQVNAPFPLSEIAVKGLPDKRDIPELKAVKQKLPTLVEEVRQVVMNWNIKY